MTGPDAVTEKTKVMETQGLAVGYGTRTVVADINQEMLKGQFVCLLGPNGSGKTTILRSLSRLLSPLKGAIYLDGRMLCDLAPHELARSLAVVLTERLSPGLVTAFEFVAMGRYPYTDFLGRLSEQDVEKIQESLRLVNATDIADRYFNELSDGERQKVLVARALAQEPEVIILDEPTVHLDLKHRIEIMSILRDFCRKKEITVIVSLHDVDLALKISEIVVLVKDGAIMAWGPPDEVLKEGTVARLYDLDCARFDRKLGTIELINSSNGRTAFVVAGGGTGTPIYRILSRSGLRLMTGVIHENDIDYHIARSIGATVIYEKSFKKIKNGRLRRSIALLGKTNHVIDSGFPIGSSNRRNLILILNAVEEGKRVYTLRSRKAAHNLYGESAEKLIYCGGCRSILEEIMYRET
ncbi:MAG: ABC transporter ATP-binding protein [Deltaproteobacteria bacterium]|nr:ABC transporter ATP-binding protein [Deltaproteobacteria bacterium]MBW2077730.1 ABC transporter ATP-binding protein [Deltaproteobacteria bacterium]